MERAFEQIVKNIDKRGEQALNDIMTLSKSDYLELKNFESKTYKHMIDIEKEILLCDKHLSPTSSVIEKAKFANAMEKQPTVLDKADESNTCLVPPDISSWSTDIAEWLKTSLVVLNSLKDQVPWLTLNDNDNVSNKCACIGSVEEQVDDTLCGGTSVDNVFTANCKTNKPNMPIFKAILNADRDNSSADRGFTGNVGGNIKVP